MVGVIALKASLVPAWPALCSSPQAPWGLDLPWPPFLPLPLLWRLWRLPCLRAPDQQARQGVEDGVGQAPAPLPCFAPHRVSEAEHAQRDVWSCGRRKRLANSYARI